MERLKNKMISSEVCTDGQRLVNTCRQHKYKNIPARLDKKSGCGDGFASADEQVRKIEQWPRAAVDLSVNHPAVILIANCITARENRGISNIQSIGNGVVMETIKGFSK